VLRIPDFTRSINHQPSTFMHDLSVGSTLLVVVVSLFTAAAAVWDLRYRRIPNALTVPVFLAGWVYQAAFHGGSGLAQGALGFALGFGMLFILWLIGGGGGGDVKLMGALSVWLGFHLTLLVVILSTVLVVAGTFAAVLWGLARGGLRREIEQRVATGDLKPGTDAAHALPQRRIMAYAIPVFVATWAILIWKLPTLP
jgi:prepilin peptidase CpaA